VPFPYPGFTGQLQIQGLFSDDTVRLGLNTYAVWSTSDATKVTVDQLGNINCLAIGTATITAKLQGVSGTLAITVGHTMFADSFASGDFSKWDNHYTLAGGTIAVTSGTDFSGDGFFATSTSAATTNSGGVFEKDFPVAVSPTTKFMRMKARIMLTAWSMGASGADGLLQIIDPTNGKAVELYLYSTSSWTLGATAADGTFIQMGPTMTFGVDTTWHDVELTVNWSGAQSVYTLVFDGTTVGTLTDTTTGTQWVPDICRFGLLTNPSAAPNQANSAKFDACVVTDN
jgi:hypothetical protein